MKITQGQTPWYDTCGILRAHDENNRPIDEVYYVMTTPVHGKTEFILAGVNTILDKKIDIAYHMESSRDRERGIQKLRRHLPDPKGTKRKRGPGTGAASSPSVLFTEEVGHPMAQPTAPPKKRKAV
jgi:hypothetical protein